MPSPNEFLILQNLQVALKGIAINRGYHYDLQSLAVKLDPNQDVESLIAPDGPRPVIVLAVNPDEWVYFPAGEVEITLPVDIHWFNDSDPTDDDSLMRTFFNGCADVEQAIVPDYSRGGLVEDTRITQRTAIRHVDGSTVWAVISTRMKTHRTYGRP